MIFFNKRVLYLEGGKQYIYSVLFFFPDIWSISDKEYIPIVTQRKEELLKCLARPTACNHLVSQRQLRTWLSASFQSPALFRSWDLHVKVWESVLIHTDQRLSVVVKSCSCGVGNVPFIFFSYGEQMHGFICNKMTIWEWAFSCKASLHDVFTGGYWPHSLYCPCVKSPVQSTLNLNMIR